MTDLAENADRQRELYGETLAVLIRRIMAATGLTQARVAETIGVSAPMLSQLLSAQRVKLGNPAAVHRLQRMVELADAAAGLSPAQLGAALAEIRDDSSPLSTSRGLTAHEVLRTAAGAEELRRLAGLTRAPALARLLRRAAGDG